MTLTEQRLDALTEKHGAIYWAAQRSAFAKLVAEVKAYKPPHQRRKDEAIRQTSQMGK